MHFDAVPHEVRMGREACLERRIDIIEVNVGGKTVDGRIDAGGTRPEHTSALRQKARQRLQIGEASFINSGGLEAPNALIVISLEIVFPRPFESLR